MGVDKYQIECSFCHMATFKEFIKSIQDDGNDGKAFERFCKWFLINDPYWKTQVDNAWLFSEWHDRWGPDNGIDLIFKHRNGDIWAVQAKCYDEKYSVSKTDMDSFLTESNRALIKHRILMASTNNMGRNAQRACAAQEKPVTLYMLKDFEAAQVEYPSHISELTSVEPKAKPLPDPHQTRAITDVFSKFRDHDRGQLIMACGTGKTFTTLWIKEALAAQTTLVLVPSLNLLSQTLNEWAFAAKNSFEVLCVCSDKTVGKRDKEDMDLGEAPFSVTSDLSIISDFISKGGHQVIFCTYQSSDLIAEVQSNKAVGSFDLVIADEAHRCSGRSDAAFSKVLDSDAIRATKRLFTTATPRLYSSSVKRAAADRGIEVYDMDDEAAFGAVLHTLPFGQAIAEDLLNDYQVVIVGVDQPMIKEWIENQELLGVNPDNVTDARTLAAKIGLLKAIKDYGLTRVISFHSRVNAARDFAAEVSELVDLIEPSNRLKGSLWSSYVSGAMRTTDRIIEIDKLKSLESADIGILANARCLSEGVDVPSLDGIAFIDPRGSQVDIIQAVGRAIRKIRGASTQTKGTIVLPVFIEEGDDAEAQIEASNFKPVWDVLKALRSHDEVLAESLDQHRTNMAKLSGAQRQTLDDRIIFDLPTTVDPSFSSALSTVLVEATTASWDFWFGLLLSFCKKTGHVFVPKRFITDDGYSLGSWIMGNRQRKKQGKLKQSRIDKLTSVGFVWSAKEEEWLRGLPHLKDFYEKHGHSFVPNTYRTEDGFGLGFWLNRNRKLLRDGALEKHRINRLKPFNISLDAQEAKWKHGYQKLKAYFDENGHSSVPTSFKTADGFNLGNWVSVQRSNRKGKHAKSLLADRIEKLDRLNFVWDKLEANWLFGLKALEGFINTNGHSRVPNDYKTTDGFQLGFWIGNLNLSIKKGGLDSNRQQQLDAIGFRNNSYENLFLFSVERFVEAKEQFGEKKIPSGFINKNGNYVGQWIVTQRQKFHEGLLSNQRIKILESVGFDFNEVQDTFLKNVNLLKEYFTKHGDTNVPQDYRTTDGFALGLVVTRLRAQKKREELSSEQITELNSINFIWDAIEYKWNQAIIELQGYISIHGDALVPAKFITKDGFNLGKWINHRRNAYKNGKLSKKKILELEALGFVWNTNKKI